ncbi:MAG: hypothetical protein Q8Q55_00300, partial [Undibacterium sp.]|nr:hypothetical protein [Undibacterium sp.]
MVTSINGSNSVLNFSTLGMKGRNSIVDLTAHQMNGQRIAIDVSSGRLTINNQDEFLHDNGLDMGVLRTYDSQGNFLDDNGDNWTTGFYAKRLELTGAPGMQGSLINRRDEYGIETKYVWEWEAQSYQNASGQNFNDTIKFEDGNLVWINTAHSVTETYSALTGRLSSSVDALGGHRIDYFYAENGLLSSVTSDTGEAVYYDYNGNNLTDVRTKIQSSDGNWAEQTRVRYEYDDNNRLIAVSVDLSPTDNQIEDGHVFRTTYTYDGTSKRLLTIGQSNGTQLSFSYLELDGEYRLASFGSNEQETTRFQYDLAANTTKIIDPLNQETVLYFDELDRIVRFDAPAVDQFIASTRFEYDSSGNVSAVIDPLNRTVEQEYDSNGNQIRVRDAFRNITERRFNEFGQVLSVTVREPAPESIFSNESESFSPSIQNNSSAFAGSYERTSRNYYDYPTNAVHAGLLRFSISPEGRIKEYRYNAQGQRISSFEYTAQKLNAYNLNGEESLTQIAQLVQASVPDVDSSALVRNDVHRTDTAYDVHGQIAKLTRFAEVTNDQDLTGVIQSSTEIRYVYDQSGKLLSKIDVAAGQATNYSYDGLGRLVAVLNGTTNVSATLYDDSHQRVVVSKANGDSTVSLYDQNGRLISASQVGINGSMKYFYDGSGRIQMTQDIADLRTWFFYDGASRKTAELKSDGRLTEYFYTDANEIAHTIVYATIVDVSTLVDSNGAPTSAALAEIRPSVTSADQRNWFVYDRIGREILSVGTLGTVTEKFYDIESRLLDVVRYKNTIDVSQFANVIQSHEVNIQIDELGDS